MSTYPQQHEPWRPDYPPVWNGCCETYIHDFVSKPKGFNLVSRNLKAFSAANSIINKVMKQ